MSFRQIVPGLALVFSLVSTLAFAAPPEQGRSAGGGGGGSVLSLLPPDAVSDHVLNADGKSIPYTATAGTLDLFGQDGERTAAIFYTAYVAKNRDAGRPITFVFNGGPGAASAFLSLGLVGPRILDFGPSGRDGANAKLVDNPQSWLNFTDLVLIDPIGTGWSRTVKSDDAKEFYSVRADAESLAKAIALYVAHNGRAASPKYILGESYGGLRSAKVATSLRQDQGILISGIVMLSPLIEGRLVFGAERSRTRSGARIAVAGRCRVGAEKCLQRAGGSGRRKICAERISAHSCRPASDRRCRSCVLRPRGQADRHSRGCRCQEPGLSWRGVSEAFRW